MMKKVLLPLHWKSYMDFNCHVYIWHWPVIKVKVKILHILAAASSKLCKIFETILLPSNGKSRLIFQFAYLHFALVHSIGQRSRTYLHFALVHSKGQCQRSRTYLHFALVHSKYQCQRSRTYLHFALVHSKGQRSRTLRLRLDIIHRNFANILKKNMKKMLFTIQI